MSTEAKPGSKALITIAVIGALGAILAALFGNQILTGKLLSTPVPTSTPLSSLDQILTADAIDTQRAEYKATVVSQATQTAQAIATQKYLIAYATAAADYDATMVYLTAEQNVATEKARSIELTAQANISAQGTSTALAVDTIQMRMDNFWAQIPNLQPTFIDGFENDSSGWSPTQASSYSVTINHSQLNISVANTYRKLPFIWACDKCGPYSNFLMQVDMTTPPGVGNVLAGVLFGSPITLAQPTFQYSYALVLDSSGAIYLQRLSAFGAETIQLWDKRTDLISPDGKPHTIQIIGYEQYLSVYINGNNIVRAFQLPETTSGYLGFIVSTAGNTNVQYDNFKIVTMP